MDPNYPCGKSVDGSGTERNQSEHSECCGSPIENEPSEATTTTRESGTKYKRRGYLKAATAMVGLGTLVGAFGTVAAASRSWVGRWHSGQTSNLPRVMNVEMYACQNVSESNRDNKVDAMRDGLNTVESATGTWFDGWELVVYDASLELTCNGNLVSQMSDYLDDLGEDEKINYHFIHKCNNSLRNNVTAWDAKGISSYSTNNDFYTFSDVRVFHECLHNFIDMTLDDVRDLAEGDSNYQMEHSLGTVDNSSRTIMADRYKHEAENLGECDDSFRHSGAKMEISECTRKALKYTSDDRA